MTGRYFEDFTEGDRYLTTGRTVTETDLINFTSFAGIFEELYQDVDYALNRSIFRARVVPGLCTLALAEGLQVQSGIFHRTGLAFLGIDNLRFVAPVFVGDTIRVETVCADKRVSNSKPDVGIVRFSLNVLKDTDTVCLTLEKVRMIQRRQL
jgi:acyl dehydratase